MRLLASALSTPAMAFGGSFDDVWASSAVIGLVGSFLGAIGIAFGCRYLRNDLSTSEDVERELGLPVLGAIPSSRQKKVQFN